MIEYYKSAVFENYVTFSGRARRSEYWYFILANIVLVVAFCSMNALISEFLFDTSGAFFILLGIYGVSMILPLYALISRRLHDINKSGWYYFVRFIPLIGPIWFIILMCTEGDHGRNNYGDDPKLNYEDIDEIGTVNNY